LCARTFFINYNKDPFKISSPKKLLDAMEQSWHLSTLCSRVPDLGALGTNTDKFEVLLFEPPLNFCTTAPTVSILDVVPRKSVISRPLQGKLPTLASAFVFRDRLNLSGCYFICILFDANNEKKRVKGIHRRTVMHPVRDNPAPDPTSWLAP
jgi:hypothetical protein